MHNQNKILRVLQLITLLKKEPAKSIRFLAGILESTDRTVYRYLDLVKELGFELYKDHNNKYHILGENEYQSISFSNEEVSLLRDLVLFSNIISLESYKINYFLINDLGLIYKIQQRLKLI